MSDGEPATLGLLAASETGDAGGERRGDDPGDRARAQPAAARPAPRSRSAGMTVHVAGFWRRAGGAAIDAGVILPVSLVLTWLTSALAGIRLPAGKQGELDFWLDLRADVGGGAVSAVTAVVAAALAAPAAPAVVVVMIVAAAADLLAGGQRAHGGVVGVVAVGPRGDPPPQLGDVAGGDEDQRGAGRGVLDGDRGPGDRHRTAVRRRDVDGRGGHARRGRPATRGEGEGGSDREGARDEGSQVHRTAYTSARRPAGTGRTIVSMPRAGCDRGRQPA